MNLLRRIIEKINRIDVRVFIFIVLGGNILSFCLESNEELHLQYAKHYFNPDWIPNSFILSDWPGYRVVFQTFLFPLISYFDFETTAFIARLVSVLLFTIALSRLFRLLQFTNIDVLLLLQLYFFFNQAFFGGEWILGSIEPKTLAYPFIFFSLCYLLKEKIYHTYIFLVVATYLHVLAGAWAFVLFSIYLLLTKHNLTRIISSSVAYILLLSPFLYYLLKELIVNNQNVINGIDINWVIVYIRSPHHFGPFLSMTYFFQNFLLGILFSISSLLTCIFIFSKYNDEILKKLNKAAIITFAMLLLFVCISYFDKNGHFMKYHPFRLSALSMFLFFCLAILCLKKYLISEKYLFQYSVIIFLLSVTPLGYSVMQNIGRSYTYYIKANTSVDQLAKFVKENTQRDDIFLILNSEELSFPRKAEREVFVIYKFFYSQPQKIYEWYMRMKEQEILDKDINHITTTLKKYRIDYVLSKNIQHFSQLDVVYKNDAFYLYKIRKENSLE